MGRRGEESRLDPSASREYLSPLAVWALSFGCILGWGAFLMPGSTLLPIAGPLGTIVALVLGGLAMVAIAANLQCMASRYPDSGGAFTYVRKLFGYDHAFLCAWSLILAFVAVMWANATSVVLLSRFLLGPVFQFGFHYVVAGYDVYFGEVLVTLIVLDVFGLLSCWRKRVVTAANTAFALMLLLGTVLCFVLVATNSRGLGMVLEPPFQPHGSVASQVLSIVALAPWAYVGFESVSHSMGETSFSVRRLFPLLVAAIASGAAVYCMTTAISVMGTPDSYGSWVGYVNDLGGLDGLDALPVFNALRSSAGDPGLIVLALVILSAISTSLIGLYRASGRLIHAMAEQDVIPEWFAQTNEEGVPCNAIMFVMIASVLVPFVGRAAIGWIVDVTSVSASIAYCYVSACALKVARKEDRRLVQVTAVAGMLFSAVFFVFPLMPNLWSVSALATESYLILAAWSLMGLVLFRLVFQRDRKGRFGSSPVVWMAMLSIVFFAATMWMRQSMHDTTSGVANEIGSFYSEDFVEHGVSLEGDSLSKEREFLERESREIQDSLMTDSLVQMTLILASLAVMLSIYSLMREREREHDRYRVVAEENSRAKTEFLSNMSHDIRTPMNAIIGYTSIARREGTSPDEMRGYLKKIDASSQHLLALINDVLEMSRIESGKMELDPVACNLQETMDDVRDMFMTQMAEKHITFVVDATDVAHPWARCDTNRLNRVLLNLLSNAYKFTPDEGEVRVTLRELSSGPEARATYRLEVSDSGIGMTPEFAARVFDAFERERSSTVSGIQGTGLGMAITKSIVDLMDGTIDVETELGEGTTFVITLELELLGEDEVASLKKGRDEDAAEDVDFHGRRILVVEDNDLNLEIAVFLMEDLGFEVDAATNGQEALDKLLGSDPGYYDAVLTDIQMPVMDGYEATRRIRALPDERMARIPIVACSANAFEEDVLASLEAGMDAHVAKPLDMDELVRVLAKLVVHEP